MSIHHRRELGTVVDLFSGCGGLSLGAELAGFRSAIAVDVDSDLQSGYRRNFPQTKAIQGNVADIQENDWRSLLGGLRPDGVIGGPPCQGFSSIGRRSENDPRNTMIGEFVRHVNILRPKFFMMENVEGLLRGHGKRILDAALEALSTRYSIVQPTVIDASALGAATFRRRVVIVGYDPDEMGCLGNEMFARLPGPAPTVRDAISDLPRTVPEGGSKGDFDWAQILHSDIHSAYASGLQQLPPAGLGNALIVNQLRKGLITGMTETKHSDKIALRYAGIEPGKCDPITKSYKLSWDGQCPTLRAGTGADRGAFQAVRPLHPSEGRVITVREAARLQGFPDWFGFHPTKWHSFRMIGNSVPPPVSKTLISRIADAMHVSLAA